MHLTKSFSSVGKRFFSTVMDLKLISSSKCFEGEQRVYTHNSKTLKCEMTFGMFMPPTALEDSTKCPVMYFLSGLTSTHENFIHKTGMQQYAAKYGLVVVNPDTSPRNVIPGEDDSYDIGSGASFYVDATVEPWSKHYKMYTYVTQELPELINSCFPVDSTKAGIFGHSMGGHGALICALKSPELYKSVSVFAPVANVIESKLGKKVFSSYLGTNRSDWQKWDATNLAEKYNGTFKEILFDMGSNDEYLKSKELLPENFINACSKNEHLKVLYKLRDGYDHDYFYVSTFIGEHFAYHAKLLKS